MTDKPDYRGFRMTTIHCIVAIDDNDEEGIPAITVPFHGSLPLIAANEERLIQITTMAQKVADDMGKNFKIVRFSMREDIGEIRSKKLS